MKNNRKLAFAKCVVLYQQNISFIIAGKVVDGLLVMRKIEVINPAHRVNFKEVFPIVYFTNEGEYEQIVNEGTARVK